MAPLDHDALAQRYLSEAPPPVQDYIRRMVGKAQRKVLTEVADSLARLAPEVDRPVHGGKLLVRITDAIREFPVDGDE
jgi:hypothetical protein